MVEFEFFFCKFTDRAAGEVHHSKAPFTLRKIFCTGRINMARVPKDVARIACLHVPLSAVPTTAKSNFGTAKSSFSTSCRLSFWSAYYETTAVRMRHVSFKHGGGKVSWVPPHKKEVVCNWNHCDQQRSINLFHRCIFEISQFYLCFLTLLEHFYTPPSYLSAFLRYLN